MAKKTFKIGERAVGGIIAVEITGKVIQVEAQDYFSRKVVMSGTTDTTDSGAERKLDFFLNDLTSSYHAGKIMEWVKSKVQFTNEGW